MDTALTAGSGNTTADRPGSNGSQPASPIAGTDMIMAQFAQLFARDADFVNVVGMSSRTAKRSNRQHAHSHATFFRTAASAARLPARNSCGPTWQPFTSCGSWSARSSPTAASASRAKAPAPRLVKNDRAWLIHLAQNTDILAVELTRPAPK